MAPASLVQSVPALALAVLAATLSARHASTGPQEEVVFSDYTQKAQALLESGRRPEARKLLLEVDQRFGGLAAPRSVEMQLELNCNPADQQTRGKCERAEAPAAAAEPIPAQPFPARR